MSGELTIENVSVSVGAKTLVRNVSLRVAPGEVVALVGPNGAGKTTLLRTLYRAQRPTAGRVLLDGDDVWRTPAKKVAQRLAAVLQDTTGDFELTVFDVVAMGRTPHKRAFEGDTDVDRAIIGEALSALDIADLTNAPFSRLSGGQKQRTLIARALTQRAVTIVLDEPTNHLDLRHQHDALHLLRRTGTTVVAALHDLNLAIAYCDRICVLDAGEIVALGVPAEVLTADLIADVYGVDVDIAHHPRMAVPQITVIPRVAECI
ncbi:ABC transporter ATP-binding protein [Mycobacterium sp.]|uniref:ABC transporter ATP-binding protein n=1 Tax=Mycobacterium sp. TaxID=1785 RepID=UPI002D814550|nr:ABC transporter ATP-binding protein [Mycobacterium sp.]